ncbi:MAG: ribosomal protein S18-alanine N-acetyltransferase [Mycobacteriales bacterium]
MIAALRWWQLAPVVALERVLFGEECWSEEAFWSELAQYETRHYVAAWDGGDLQGYAGLAAYREEAWVQTIGVAPSQQCRGLGTALLVDLMTEARRRDAETVALEVRADNAPAQELYRRHGFTVAGRRRGYYQPSGADALVMVAVL